jgi:hypothetical protein
MRAKTQPTNPFITRETLFIQVTVEGLASLAMSYVASNKCRFLKKKKKNGGHVGSLLFANFPVLHVMSNLNEEEIIRLLHEARGGGGLVVDRRVRMVPHLMASCFGGTINNGWKLKVIG